MKRLLIFGVILRIMALGILLACAKVYTKTKGGSKHMKITINTETGELVKVTDEKNNPATALAQAEIEQICQNQAF